MTKTVTTIAKSRMPTYAQREAVEIWGAIEALSRAMSDDSAVMREARGIAIEHIRNTDEDGPACAQVQREREARRAFVALIEAARG